jgi:glycogen operon protein
MRNRQIKNFFTTTIMSLGVPMILMGDEVRRTQGGNNNAYCHDDELSWFNWSDLAKHADMHRFLKLLIERRLLRTIAHSQQRTSLSALLEQANKAWHGVKLFEPDWSDDSHSVALESEIKIEGIRIMLILNAYWEPLVFELPQLEPGRSWHRWIDTGLESPNDIVPWDTAPVVTGASYRTEARSVVMLYASGES